MSAWACIGSGLDQLTLSQTIPKDCLGVYTDQGLFPVLGAVGHGHVWMTGDGIWMGQECAYWLLGWRTIPTNT